jgi:hypothetical protein
MTYSQRIMRTSVGFDLRPTPSRPIPYFQLWPQLLQNILNPSPHRLLHPSHFPPTSPPTPSCRCITRNCSSITRAPTKPSQIYSAPDWLTMMIHLYPDTTVSSSTSNLLPLLHSPHRHHHHYCHTSQSKSPPALIKIPSSPSSRVKPMSCA